MTVAILVVDDEPDVVELFSQRFRREVRHEQCALHFAGTGKEALDLLGADLNTDDTVVLMDIRMLDMSGNDLMEEIETAILASLLHRHLKVRRCASTRGS